MRCVGKRAGTSATQAVKQAREFAKTLGPELDLRLYGFDSKLTEPKAGRADRRRKPAGTRDVARHGDAGSPQADRRDRARMARLVMISDFATNSGSDPLDAARSLKGQGVPVVTVGLGTENAGAVHRDIKCARHHRRPDGLREKPPGRTGHIVVNGFTNQTLEVELLVEGQTAARRENQVKVPDGTDVIPITGL